MKIDFNYKGIPPFEVDDENVVGVYEPNSYQSELSEEEIIEQGLDNPIGTPRIRDMVKKGQKVLILVDDYTRPTPANKILPPVLKELDTIGIKNEDISILMAQGTHRRMSKEEKEKKLGKSICQRLSVFDHQWNNEEILEYIGNTRSGIPIWVNKLIRQYDFIMGIGCIVPHSEAGFSGGAKIIQPGVCGRITTEGTHWLAASFKTGQLMGQAENPVRHEMEEIARKVGLKIIINVVQDKEGRIVGLFCGDPVKAHRKGCQLAIKIYGVRIPFLSDIVVINSYPMDMDLWVAAKAIFAAGLAIKRNGIIILITPCPEGVTSEHPEILNYKFLPYKDVEKLVKKGKLINDLVGAAFLAMVGNIIVEKAKCIMVSPGIDSETACKLGFITARTPQTALKKAFDRLGRKAKVMVFNHGSEVLPLVEDRM